MFRNQFLAVIYHFIITREVEGRANPLLSDEYFSFLHAVVDEKSNVGLDFVITLSKRSNDT
ncbi:MAG: hypothetical protein ACWGN2_10170 [Anaerolineales bacterium]